MYGVMNNKAHGGLTVNARLGTPQRNRGGAPRLRREERTAKCIAKRYTRYIETLWRNAIPF